MSRKYLDYRSGNGRREKKDSRTIGWAMTGNDRQEYFRCVHCKMLISTNLLISGVHHRNHCPFCLWSRHVDLYHSGDRLAACKSHMEPVGLSLKRERKRYAGEAAGELMLVHFCIECGSLSINRMAADDCEHRLFDIYTASWQLDSELHERIALSDIRLLGRDDQSLVETRLFGIKTSLHTN